MTWKPTIVVSILAALGVLAAVFTSPAERGPRRALAIEEALLGAGTLDPDRLERIILTRRGQDPLVFERRAEGWMQTEPFEYPMERHAMRRLAAAAVETKRVDRFEPDEGDGNALTTAALSLDPPEARITYEWTDESLSIDFGRKGVGGRAYLRMGGESAVSVVDQQLHELAVDQDPREWRDRAIFREVGIESERITREASDARFVLERDRRQWRMVEPVQTRVDRVARDEFFQALGAARAKGFVADRPRNLARFGLEPPVAHLSVEISRRIEGDNGETTRVMETQRLLIGSQAGSGTQDRFAMIDGRPVVLRVPAATLAALFRNPRDIIDPTGSGVSSADIKRIMVREGDQEFRMERDLDRWVAPDAGGTEIRGREVDALLELLTERRASDVSIMPYPHELERGVITFFGYDNRPLDTVRVIYEEASDRWALENGDDVVRVLPEGVAVPLDAQAFGIPN